MKNKLLILFALFLFGLFLPKISHAARLWATGFELQSVTSGVDFGTGVDVAISTTTKRSGAASLSCPTGGDYFSFTFSAAEPTVDHFARFYLNIAGYPPSAMGRIWEFRAFDGTRTTSIKLNTNGTLELWDEDGDVTPVQLGSDSSVLQLNTWYRIEVAFDYIADQDNTVTAYIDGVSFATGNDVGGATADQPVVMYLGAIGSTISGGIFIDDVAINDSTNSSQTSLPGAGSIVYLQVDGNGDINEANAGDWDEIEEVTPDDATSYLELDDTNDDILFTTGSSAGAGIDSYDVITLVQVGIRHANESTSAWSFTPKLESASGGTLQSGTAFTHNDTTWKSNGDVVPRNYKLTSYTDPDTAVAWTPTGTNSLDNMQIGGTATDADTDCWISTLWTLVEYTEGSPPSGAVNQWYINIDE